MPAEYPGPVGEALATVRDELCSAAPDPQTAAGIDAYLHRVLAGAMTDSLLADVMATGGLVRSLPTKGAPNPDYLMSHARIDAARRYRIHGWLGDSERIGIGAYRVDPAGRLEVDAYATVHAASVSADGRFAVEVGVDAESVGALRITEHARLLIVRILHRDAQGIPASVAMTGAQAQPVPPDGALDRAAAALVGSVRQFLRWSQLLSAEPNRLAEPPDAIADEAQGDPDTTYRFGYYRLGDDESLHVTIPGNLAGHWSLHAYNHWCEVIAGAGVHDRSAVVDPDGDVHIHIGPTAAPEAGNHLDTRGERRGVLVFRAIGTRQVPAFDVRLRKGHGR